MVLTERESEMLRQYEEWVPKRGPDPHELWLDVHMYDVLAAMPDGPLLDMGCGDGRYIAVLEHAALDGKFPPERYLGVDLSPAQISLAQKLHPKHRFEVGSLYEVGQKYPGHFTGLICVNVLMHVPRERVPVALSSLRASLQKGAMADFDALPGEGETIGPTGMLLTRFEDQELKALFAQTGFDAWFSLNEHESLRGIVEAV